MEHDQDESKSSHKVKPRAPVNFGAFLLVFLFVWVVFDNFALGLIFAFFVAGGTEVAQRAVNKKSGPE